jgi:hypothetical protein
VRGAAGFAFNYQRENGALGWCRCSPASSAAATPPTTWWSAAVTAMRIRGPIDQQVHDLPDGARIRFSPS